MTTETGLLNRLAPWIAVAAAIAVYVNSLANGFAYDDVFIIEKNTRVHDLRALRDIFLTPYWPFFGTELGLYRPFIIFLYAVQWAIGDGAPWVFHAGSILFHATATLLVFFLIDVLAGRTPALAAALVFAVHPVHAEAVANVVGQAEIVAAIMVLAACNLHVRRPAGTHVGWPLRLALVLFFTVGIATKESAVVLPGLLIGLDFVQRRVTMSARGWLEYVRSMATPVLLLAAALGAYLLVRYDALSGALIGIDAGPSLPYLREQHRVLNALRAFPEFIRLLFFPLDLSADYSPGVILPVESITGMTVLGAMLLLGMVALMFATPWVPFVGFPAAWFVISISPVANIFFPIGVLIAERTLYLPSVALSILVGFAWARAADRVSAPARRLAPALLLVALVLMGVRTWIRNPDWKDTFAVMGSLLRDHPESYKAQWVHAELLSQQGHPAEAEYHYSLAYRVYPRDSQFLQEYGLYMLRTGRYERGVELLEEAYALHPYVPRTVAVLAHAYVAVERYEDALEVTGRAEYYGAPRYVSMPLRAHAYHGLGDHDRAVAAWRSAVADARDNASTLTAFLARSLAIAGYDSAAIAAADRAIAAASDSAVVERFQLLRSSIRDGCFAGFAGVTDRNEAGADSTVADSSAPRPLDRMPACDVLGDWFLATGQTHFATLLHIARSAADSTMQTRTSPDM